MKQSILTVFISETSLEYNLPIYCQVKIDVYDVMGRKICTILDEPQLAGSYSFEWNGLNNMNNHVPMGIYLIRMSAGPYKATRKVAFVR